MRGRADVSKGSRAPEEAPQERALGGPPPSHAHGPKARSLRGRPGQPEQGRMPTKVTSVCSVLGHLPDALLGPGAIVATKPAPRGARFEHVSIKSGQSALGDSRPSGEFLSRRFRERCSKNQATTSVPRQAVWGAGRGGNKRSLPCEDRSSSSWVGPVGHGGASAENLFDDVVEWLLLTTPVSQTAEVHPRAQTYQHHRNGKRTDRPSATPVRAPFCSGRSPRKRRSPRPRRAQEAGLSP